MSEVSGMKTITICGSMRYEKDMPTIALHLERKHGYNVLQCVYNFTKEALTPLDIDMLKKAHYKKIELSDAIYVVDIQGYIGNSVREEIQFAKEKGKEIIMHSSFDL